MHKGFGIAIAFALFLASGMDNANASGIHGAERPRLEVPPPLVSIHQLCVKIAGEQKGYHHLSAQLDDLQRKHDQAARITSSNDLYMQASQRWIDESRKLVASNQKALRESADILGCANSG
jgi:hypothetical protein